MDLDDPCQMARVHENTGHLYVANGQTREAIRAFREAATVYRAEDLPGALAATRAALANALALAGDLEGAQAELKAAQVICATRLDAGNLILARSSLIWGRMLSDAGHHAAADGHLRQALTLMEHRDVQGLGEVCLALGINAGRRGLWSEAVPHLERASSVLQSVAERRLEAAAARYLCEAYWQTGAAEAATQTVRRAGNLAASIGDWRGVAWAAVRLAEMAAESEDLITARMAAAEARGCLAQRRWPPRPASEPLPAAADQEGANDEARADDRSALLAARLERVGAALARADGRPEVAIAHLRSAVAVLRNQPSGIDLLRRTYRELARALREAGRWDDAVACYEAALDTTAIAVDQAGPAGRRLESAFDHLTLAATPSQLWFRS
jgi:tetratricopeptide (TPR) repeat protein